METFVVILLCGIIFFIILFILIMLWDCWRYENPGWFLLLLFSSLIIVPFVFYLNDLFCYLQKYPGIILYPMEEYRNIRELDVGGDLLYLLVFSLIPFSLSFIYYCKKFKSPYLSSRLLLSLFLSFLFLICICSIIN